MDDIFAIFTDANSTVFISLFVKAFAILFSVLFLLYAIVITRQTQEMNQTFTTKKASVLVTVAVVHILFAVLLIFASIVLI